MTEFQKHKLTYLFGLLDINKNGFIQLNDFSDISEKLVEKAGYEMQSKQHRFVVERCVGLFYKLLKDIPGENNKEIRLENWLAFFDEVLYKSHDEEVLEEYVLLFFEFIFKIFDENNDGYISRKEYKDIFEIYGIDQNTIEFAFDAMDSYKDGKLSRYELKHAIEAFFLSDDPKDSGNYIFGNIAF